MAISLLELEPIINNTLSQLCDELLKLKQSYFTTQGKKGWNPLKQSTIERKQRAKSSTVYDFNNRTGELVKSMKVFYSMAGNRVTISVRFDDDESKIKNLTQRLGRDFVTIDRNEKKFIKKTFYRLFFENVKKR